MTSSPTHDTPQATSFRLALLGVLVVVLLAAVGTSIWLIATRGAEPVGIQGEAAEIQAERETVMSQTRQFMLRMGTYGPDQLENGQLPEYRDQVSEVITPKFRTSFEKSLTTVEQLVAQAGVARQAQVFATGVATIDADSATSLVAGTFTDAYPTRKSEMEPQDPVPFRIQVTLVKTDGEWLVDDFTPVTGAAP